MHGQRLVKKTHPPFRICSSVSATVSLLLAEWSTFLSSLLTAPGLLPSFSSLLHLRPPLHFIITTAAVAWYFVYVAATVVGLSAVTDVATSGQGTVRSRSKLLPVAYLALLGSAMAAGAVPAAKTTAVVAQMVPDGPVPDCAMVPCVIEGVRRLAIHEISTQPDLGLGLIFRFLTGEHKPLGLGLRFRTSTPLDELEPSSEPPWSTYKGKTRSDR